MLTNWLVLLMNLPAGYNVKVIAIIPARYQSTRFPGKPLADLGGKPVIQYVYERVIQTVEDVFVATDDGRIFSTVNEFGGKAIMTQSTHKSGTDRCYEAYKKTGIEADIILNIQGDEPFIHTSQLKQLISVFQSENTDIATLIKPFSRTDSLSSLINPNTPKVVISKDKRALYFSRSVIPFIRNIPQEEWLSNKTFYKHIGVYGYRPHILKEIIALEQSSLELAESLEQLRWLENGYRIGVEITEYETIGIDTPEDLGKAVDYLSSQEYQLNTLNA
jgi:3-deoxy-manno-octulosonate cytidylyltransferase (CMP-KDO synthetase)